MRRIRETFRNEAMNKEGFELEEEKRFALDIIKKKEAEGYLSDGFLSNGRTD